MKTTIERELKFEAGNVQLERLGGEPLEPHVFESTYHDTADRRLLRAHITLRRRVENGESRWQLKLPSAGSRLELEEPGGPGAVPPGLARLLSGILRGSEIEPIARLETHRQGRRIEGVEVTVDDVSVLEGMAVVGHFSEIEAELVDGSRESIDHVGDALRKLGATPAPETPKVVRVVVGLPKSRSVDPKAPALDHLRLFVRTQLDVLRGSDPIVRAADDAEAVHDMRVAVRRLRTVLRTARPMLERSWTDDLRGELDPFGQLLGSVRDLDVLIEHLTDEATEIGAAGEAKELLAPLESEREGARTELRRAMDEERYYALLDHLEGAARSLPVIRTDLTVEQLVRNQFEKLCAFEKRASDDDVHLHKLRIRGKRARYAAELAQRSRGAPATRFIEASTELQDVLGEHQDAVVALDRLQRLAWTADSSGAPFTAGRLAEREEQRKLRARHDLPRIWNYVERRGKAAW